jgi:hypothetical protein
MKPKLAIANLFPFLLSAHSDLQKLDPELAAPDGGMALLVDDNPYSRIGVIPLPHGYSRIGIAKNSFGEWLRNIGLKKSKTVYLFNGQPKSDQTAQFAVLDISVGNKDLQQCADAVMRLRAEYLYSQKRFAEIIFRDNDNKSYSFGKTGNRLDFDRYLEKVFAYCGSLSLEKQLLRVTKIEDVRIGDVMIQGGSPGHAMLLIDMAINNTGKRIYLLSQSYMPAQDIHVVINPEDQSLSPWYPLVDKSVQSPLWSFPAGKISSWRNQSN